MPQLVREARYFSHCEHGVEMGESMSLSCQLGSRVQSDSVVIPVPAPDVVIVTPWSRPSVRGSEGEVA